MLVITPTATTTPVFTAASTNIATAAPTLPILAIHSVLAALAIPAAPAVLAAPALANYAPTISALTALTPAAFTLNAPTPTVTALIAATLNALAHCYCSRYSRYSCYYYCPCCRQPRFYRYPYCDHSPAPIIFAACNTLVAAAFKAPTLATPAILTAPAPTALTSTSCSCYSYSYRSYSSAFRNPPYYCFCSRHFLYLYYPRPSCCSRFPAVPAVSTALFCPYLLRLLHLR
ncbi:hypothetical protein A1F94_013655 [Pyrenophora tritici-repentis]|nr:hypothetical protein A1F94_013655 [Pyrenophora tritici-repentis]